MQNWFNKFLFLIVLILLFSLVSSEILNLQNKNSKILEVSYLDVGQGDATLISYLGKYQVLIDGGPNGKVLLAELGKQMPRMDKKIEIVILTHPDADHLSGLIDVIDSYEIGIFLDNGQRVETKVFQELEEELEKNKIERGLLNEGAAIGIGRYLDFNVFNPDEVWEEDRKRNEQSVVLRMDFGKNSFLFTGDATVETEKDMIDDLESLDVDWLKAGHHGSKSSTSKELLKAVTAENVIFSVGEKNRYKHPSTEILERIKKINVNIFRTDEMGTVKVICKEPDTDCFVEE